MSGQRILLTGAKGMLGRTLVRRWSGVHDVVATDREELDITDIGACSEVLAETRPQVVVHCAAHTAVDRCESEPEAAYRLNALGSANIAIACQRHGARLIAISTDYVFSGEATGPYNEWDATGPQTVYGASKLAGEVAVRTHCPDHVIARIAWLYGPGGPSFVHTMLRLAAQAGEPLRVVDDQSGNPTSTDAVAEGLAAVIDRGIAGTIHLTCSGATTWYGLTQEIIRLRGLARAVVPCSTAEFPRPARRPANSRLDHLALRLHGLPGMPQWQDALASFLRAYPDG